MAEAQSRDPNRRAAARAMLRQPATVAYADATVAVQTVDVGQGGISLLAPRPIAPGTRCTIAFALPFAEGPATVCASLKVVYSSYLGPEQFKIGTVFTALDEETAQLLTRYVSVAG